MPAMAHVHAADYGRTAMECAQFGVVPPLTKRAITHLSYADPGGAATKTHLEALTLKMINNHEASAKRWSVEARDQQNRHLAV